MCGPVSAAGWSVRSGPGWCGGAYVGQLRGITAQFLINPEVVGLDTGRTTVVQFARHTLAPTAQGKGKRF
jgi:hypothetical protein